MCIFIVMIYLLIGVVLTLLNNYLLSNDLIESGCFYESTATKVVFASMLLFWPVCLSLTLRLIIVKFKYNS